MKLLENLYGFKTVEYFGHNLIVPNWTKYLACDADGSVVAFYRSPMMMEEFWLGGKHEIMAIFSLYRMDWKETLKEVG